MSPRCSPVCTTLFVAAVSASPWCAAESAIDFAIPAAPQADALLQFSETSGVKVFFSSQLAGNLRGNAVRGRLTPKQALEQLLAGTGLSAQTAADGTVTLEKSAQPADPQSGYSTPMPAVTVIGQPLYDFEDPYNLNSIRRNHRVQ